MDPRAYFRDRWLDVWLLVCALLVMGMALHRADAASFTHDESYSYMYYPRLSIAELLGHTEAFTNNHLLNSLGMKLCERWFGASELALRGPNLMALVLYLVYGALFLRPLPALAAALGYPLLIGNTYLMEFFTLARGYGLSFGLLMMALYHLHQALVTQRVAHLALFHLACILASLANLTLLGTHVAGLLTWYLALALRYRAGGEVRGALRNGTVINLIMCTLACAILAGPVGNVLSENALDFGGKGGFYQTTVLTWARSMAPRHQAGDTVVALLQAAIVLVTVVAVVLLVKRYLRAGQEASATSLALLVVSGLLLFSCLGAELQHHLFGVDRLVDRFALFLVPLVLLLFVLVMAEAMTRQLRVWASALLAGVALHSSLSFASDFGPFKSIEWQYDVNTEQAVRAVLKDIAEHPLDQRPATVAGNWLLEPSWNFYKQTLHVDHLASWDRQRSNDDAQFLLLLAMDHPEERIGYREVARFPESGCTVLRRTVAQPQTNTR